jgi:hypothetical protein
MRLPVQRTATRRAKAIPIKKKTTKAQNPISPMNVDIYLVADIPQAFNGPIYEYTP